MFVEVAVIRASDEAAIACDVEPAGRFSIWNDWIWRQLIGLLLLLLLLVVVIAPSAAMTSVAAAIAAVVLIAPLLMEFLATSAAASALWLRSLGWR